MIRNFAKDICKVEPAKNWVSRYIERNRAKLDSRFQPGFDLNRKKADNHYEYKLYFEKVIDPDWQYSYINIEQMASKIAQYNILPENTYNIDKKGFLIGVL